MGKLIASGKDGAGTVYAIDEVDDSTMRLFISHGSALERRKNVGSGAIGSGEGSSLIIMTSDNDGQNPINVCGRVRCQRDGKPLWTGMSRARLVRPH